MARQWKVLAVLIGSVVMLGIGECGKSADKDAMFVVNRAGIAFDVYYESSKGEVLATPDVDPEERSLLAFPMGNLDPELGSGCTSLGLVARDRQGKIVDSRPGPMCIGDVWSVHASSG